VTNRVHEKEGKIFCQLWHVGRVSHPLYLNGELPVAPSAVKLKGRVHRGKKGSEYGRPRALRISEIPDYIDSFIEGAINSFSAGFDGVEIHGAHGYLIDEFLHYNTNRRSDEYGGNPENMCRFTLKIIEGIIKEIGNQRVGLRLSPSAYFNLDSDERDGEVFKYLLNELNKFNIAYLHQGIIDKAKMPDYLNDPLEFLRDHYKGNIIGNENYNMESAANAIMNKECDLISFGKPFISNPDLIKKIKNGEPLLPYNSEMLNRLF